MINIIRSIIKVPHFDDDPIILDLPDYTAQVNTTRDGYEVWNKGRGIVESRPHHEWEAIAQAIVYQKNLYLIREQVKKKPWELGEGELGVELFSTEAPYPH